MANDAAMSGAVVPAGLEGVTSDFTADKQAFPVPWGNSLGAAQFGSAFFMITGFHGLHVSAGVVYLCVVATRVWSGFYDRKGTYETVEITGLYWHFVDLVWVFIFAFFYLW
jgi:cytochrome c oxidase subunit 3